MISYKCLFVKKLFLSKKVHITLEYKDGEIRNITEYINANHCSALSFQHKKVDSESTWLLSMYVIYNAMA